MAQALRVFGGEIQARPRRPFFLLPLLHPPLHPSFLPTPHQVFHQEVLTYLTPTPHQVFHREVLTYLTPTPHQVFHREVQSRRGACAYFVGRELSQLPFHLAAPGDPS